MDRWDPGVWWGQQLWEKGIPSGCGGGGQRGYTKDMLVVPVLGRLQGATGGPRPTPSTDPHHKTPEPRQSQQVYCQRQSTAKLSQGAQAVAAGEQVGEWPGAKGMLRSRPGLLGSVSPPTSPGPRSISPPGRGHPRGGFWLGLPPTPRAGGVFRVRASGSEGCSARGEQPGFTEKQELPKSPRDLRWAFWTPAP